MGTLPPNQSAESTDQDSFTRGVFYIATGKRCLEEALTSAKRVAEVHPELSLSILTDKWPEDLKDDVFDRVIEDCEAPPSWGAKPLFIHRTPYFETVFLDSDVYEIDGIADLFQTLTICEIAFAHAPARNTHNQSGLPEWFPEINTGVLAFRMTTAVRQLLSDWQSEQRKMGTALKSESVPDQWSFRAALLQNHGNLNYMVVAPEYNFRFEIPVSAHGPVKILHGRSNDYRTLEKNINKSHALRCWFGYLVTIEERRPVATLLRQWLAGRLRKIIGGRPN